MNTFALAPMRLFRRPGRITAAALVVSALVMACPAAAAQEGRRSSSPPGGTPVLALQQPAPPAGSDEFVPVSELPAQEQLPAAPLVMAAYAFVWVMLLVYLVMLWRRLTRVEQEIAGVERRIDERRRT